MTSHSENQLGNRIANAAVWSLAMRFVVNGLGVVSVVILARLLTAVDFAIDTTFVHYFDNCSTSV